MRNEAPAILVIVTPDRPRRPRSWSYKVAASGPVTRMMRIARDVADRNPVTVTDHHDTSDCGIEAQVYLMPPGAWYAMPGHERRNHEVYRATAREMWVPTAGQLGWF